MASPEDSKEKLGQTAATAERKVSDETLKRFRDFVKERATNSGPASELGATASTGLFTIETTEGQIVPANSIKYEYYKYEHGGSSGQKEDTQLSVGAGEHKLEIFGMFITTDKKGKPEGISFDVAGQRSIGMDADDEMVDGVLSAIEHMEAEGAITQAPQG